MYVHLLLLCFVELHHGYKLLCFVTLFSKFHAVIPVTHKGPFVLCPLNKLCMCDSVCACFSSRTSKGGFSHQYNHYISFFPVVSTSPEHSLFCYFWFHSSCLISKKLFFFFCIVSIWMCSPHFPLFILHPMILFKAPEADPAWPSEQGRLLILDPDLYLCHFIHFKMSQLYWCKLKIR